MSFISFFLCSVVVLVLGCYHSRKPFKQTVAIVLTFLVHIITFMPRHCYVCKQVSVRVQKETILTTSVGGITSITSNTRLSQLVLYFEGKIVPFPVFADLSLLCLRLVCDAECSQLFGPSFHTPHPIWPQAAVTAGGKLPRFSWFFSLV